MSAPSDYTKLLDRLAVTWEEHCGREGCVTCDDRVEILAALRHAAQEREALESIAANTCCATCREAALVARAALTPKGGK